MASYHKDNVSLSDALTMNLPHITRVWDVPGCNVRGKEIPKNAKVSHTFVMSRKAGKTTVGIEYTLKGDPGCYMTSVIEYSELDIKQLEKDFPLLFKLKGHLYAFGEE